MARILGYSLSCLMVLYFSRILPCNNWGQIACALSACLLLIFVFRLVAWRDVTALLKPSKPEYE